MGPSPGFGTSHPSVAISYQAAPEPSAASLTLPITGSWTHAGIALLRIARLEDRPFPDCHALGRPELLYSWPTTEARGEIKNGIQATGSENGLNKIRWPHCKVPGYSAFSECVERNTFMMQMFQAALKAEAVIHAVYEHLGWPKYLIHQCGSSLNQNAVCNWCGGVGPICLLILLLYSIIYS